MTNEKEMVLRMIEYDFHIALSFHTKLNCDKIYHITFPQSLVVYPAPNEQIPDGELTKYTKQLILILDEELEIGNISKLEYDDYCDMITQSARHLFRDYRHYQKEVENVTRPRISLPSARNKLLQYLIRKKEKKIMELDLALSEIDQKLSETHSENIRLRNMLISNGINPDPIK